MADTAHKKDKSEASDKPPVWLKPMLSELLENKNITDNTYDKPPVWLKPMLSELLGKKNELTPSEEPTYNLVVVIGNGFDLSLGLKTRYSDFINSEWWPFKDRGGIGDHGLGAYLNNKHGIEKWMDMEEELHKYCAKDKSVVNEYVSMLCANPATRERLQKNSVTGKLSEQEIRRHIEIELLQQDKRDYEVLCDHFKNYLNYMEYEKIQAGTPAGSLITAILDKIDLLFSFNYTNINRILRHLKSLSIDSDKIVFVHGSLNGSECSGDNETIEYSTAILGVDDQRPVLDEYQFMVKQYSPHFYRVNTNTKGRSLTKALKNAKHVIFFGLSFGDNDFSYFKPFFEQLDTLEILNSVTVFCYTDEDRMELLGRLARVRNTSSVKYLQFNNDFQIITTEKGKSDQQIDNFIEIWGSKLSNQQ